MKLTRLGFLILYFFLYILLPCGIDVQCEQDDAVLNICVFNMDDKNTLSHEHYYDGMNIIHRFEGNTSDFKLFLEEVLKEIREIKQKNAEYIKKCVNVEKRGIAFNKRVLIINESQIEIVFEVLRDVLGCQECPLFLFCDKSGKIKNYSKLVEFASSFLKNNKKEDKRVQNPLAELKGFFNLHIFKNDEEIFKILNAYYSKDMNEEKIISKISRLREDIFDFIEQLKKNNLLQEDDAATLMTKNNEGQYIFNFEGICEKYTEIENKILEISSNNKNVIDKKVLQEYWAWKSILLRAQIIKIFISFFDNENFVEKNEQVIKKLIGCNNIPENFKTSYNSFFFSDKFSENNLFDMLEGIKKDKNFNFLTNFYEKNPECHDAFSYYSFLDIANLFFRKKTLIKNSLEKVEKVKGAFKNVKGVVEKVTGVFGKFINSLSNDSKERNEEDRNEKERNEDSDSNILDKIYKYLKTFDDYLEELEKGSLFTEKKSVLFAMVKSVLCKEAGFNEKAFYNLDKQINDHFNSIIIKYLNNLLGMVKGFENAVWEGVTYDFHNANKFYEIIRAFGRYIAPALEKKEGRSEIVYNGILILQEALKNLNLSPSANRILMECSLVLNIIIEHFIYVRDSNAYISKMSKNKELSLKRNNISNKLDNFCIISTDEYDKLTSFEYDHNYNAPEIINAVTQRLYEYGGDEKRNDSYFNIVVMGDMRAGKTLLIRNLFDEKERFKFKVASGDTSTTSKITYYTRTYKKCEKYLQIIDTPGFEGVIKGKDLGYEAINTNFKDLFGNEDTIILDIVLFKDGCINWLSESHKDIITRILENKKNKIIFLIPFTKLKKNSKKIKEKFLASLFYILYIRDKEFPVQFDFKNFVERVIAIPINQIYNEQDSESRFGLRTMGKSIIKLSQDYCKSKKNAAFEKAFIESLPENEFCDIDKQKEQIINNNIFKNFANIDVSNDIINNHNNKKVEVKSSSKNPLLNLLCRFNNFELHKINKDFMELSDEDFEDLSDKDFEDLLDKNSDIKIDKNKRLLYHEEDYKLLKYIYLFYSGSSFFINQFLKDSYNPVMYEIYETGMYKLAEFVTSPYFFNWLCLDNESSGYNIYLFEREINLLNKKELLKEVFYNRWKILAQFCLVADDQFLISEKDYETINKACVKFNSNYDDFKPLSIEKDAMKTNYNQIKKALYTYFGIKEEQKKEKDKKEEIKLEEKKEEPKLGIIQEEPKHEEKKGENIDGEYLNFVVCYDPTQRRYILDRTNLCFLEIKLKRDEKNKLYEIIPESLKNHIKKLNEAMKGIERYEDFENKIQDKDNEILYERYHHKKEEGELIRNRERECIKVVFKAIQKEKEEEEKKKEEEKDNGGILGNIFTGVGNLFNLFNFRNNGRDEVIKNNLRAWNNAT